MASYLRGGPNDDGRDEDGVSRSTSYRQSQQTYLGANQQQPYDRPNSPHSGSVSPLSSVMSGGQNTYAYQQPYIDHSYYDDHQEQPRDTFEHPAPSNYQTQPAEAPNQLYGGVLPPQGAQFPATGADDENDGQKDGVAMLAQSPPARGTDFHYKNGRYAVFRRWGWEIAALVLAVALLIAMVLILHAFEGQRVPYWGEWVNLNTIMAVLSTVLRGAVAVVIAEIISQAKWEWFGTGRTRPLRDLQDFDAGSRGVWGALGLVPTAVHGDPVALLAALLLAASFAVGPTVQQAIRSSVCDYYVEGVNASLPFAHFVPRSGGYVQGYGGQRGDPDSSTRVAVSSSLNYPEGIENAVTAACRTGNCTFIEGDPVPDGVDDNARNTAHSGARSGSHSTIGLCHRCLDVTSLIKAYEDEDSSSGSVDLGLPNGLNVTRGAYGTELNVTTDLDFDWAGELVTPEFVRDARWALTNATILAISMDGCDAKPDDKGNRNCPVPTNIKDIKTAGSFGLKAASCIVYSCVRTYMASVTNGELDEVEIGSPLTTYPELNGVSKLNPEGADAKIRQGRMDQMSMTNSMRNMDQQYAAVKTPCRANNTVWWTEDEMESAPEAIKLALYETREDGVSSVHELAAPETCIYRHSAEFGAAVGKAFKDQLEGSCLIDPRTGPACTQRGTRSGYHKPLEHLYAGGNATFTGIDDYLKSVMVAMTNRYRVTYGSVEYGTPGNTGLGPMWINNEVPALPRGIAEGVVWQTTVCTVVHWEWLAFSAALVGITSLLLAATIVRSWRSRHVRPIWKANILPLLFHGDRFGLAQDPLMMTAGARPPDPKRRPTATEAYVNDNDDVDSSQMLMESREMEKQAAQITTVFRWPEGGARHSDDEASPAQGTGSAFAAPGRWARSRQRMGGKKIHQWVRDSLEQQEP